MTPCKNAKYPKHGTLVSCDLGTYILNVWGSYIEQNKDILLAVWIKKTVICDRNAFEDGEKEKVGETKILLAIEGRWGSSEKIMGTSQSAVLCWDIENGSMG